MTQPEKISAKYTCLDIVEFTKRDEDAQLQIRADLDETVKSCLEELSILQDKNRRVCVPTGDGMCIALLDTTSSSAAEALPPDVNLRVALGILKNLSRRNSQTRYRQLQFDVRIGIHADTDYLITDINGHRNLAGAGINTAFRIMNLADGGQILASQKVFTDLIRDRRNQFKRFEAKVRHDITLYVYQFIGEGEGLIKDVPKAIEEQIRDRQTHERIIKPALDLGLSKVYEFRNDNSVEDITKDMEGAKESVWLLGIGLCDTFEVTDPKVIEMLNRKISAGVKVRILLLDGFRSSAIFRALLESDTETSRRIVEARRRLPNFDDPYLAHRLFANFETNCDKLTQGLNDQAVVRFYPHTPSCWLAIIDDNTAYYQPYTFGDISADPRVGFQMPVIKLQGATTPFRILQDHYNKLWMTSDVDLFQTQTRLKAKPETLWRTFQKYKLGESVGFEPIHGVLHKKEDPGQDDRTYTRMPCFSMRLKAEVTWECGEQTKGKVIDFSYQGVLLALELATDSERFISLPEHRKHSEQKIMVELDIEPAEGWTKLSDGLAPAQKIRGLSRIEAVKHAVHGLLGDHRFTYIRKELPTSKSGRPRLAFLRNISSSRKERA